MAGGRAAKPGSKRILALMFSRMTGRIAADTAGPLCGPFPLACGSAFAVVTWVGMDIAINEIDEDLNHQ